MLGKRSRPSWPTRAAVTLVAATCATGVVVDVPASATVYDSCTISRCSDGRYAASVWGGKGWPSSAGWYSWPDGLSNYTGGVYHNYDGQLPAGATYHEYDVYSRTEGSSRDAYRIVHSSTGTVYFTPDHYSNFYRIS
ncbi:ribonuclease domain-containing protein [Actinomadura madurae]|uniref:ribonuclease domain-containing protein n=1 Tax=Actinomadura madurae TaxID=1993 RepID=UPI000D8F437F|nr:ribonuclease domain-containing protein [Actinomadura madurae]SPT51464.1 ribonuclease [Actinomadura madurae]